MIVVNFSHPLTPDQKGQILSMVEYPLTEEHLGPFPPWIEEQHTIREIIVPSQMDNRRDFLSQIITKLDAIPLTEREWKTEHIMINPPAYAPACALVIALLMERMDDFPPTIRIRPVAGSIPPTFEVAEIMTID